LKLRALGRSERRLVAAPAYLMARGRPQSPQDLSGHEGIRMTNVAGNSTLVLEGPDATRHTVPFGGRLRVDHGLAARAAMLAGRGIAPAHHWLVADCLADGRLETVLPGYAVPSVPLSLLIQPERAGTARVRLLADFLAARLRAIPGIASEAGGAPTAPAQR